MFELMGCHVMRTNHLGDWGTQFGMLTAELDDVYPDFLTNAPKLNDLLAFYQNAKKRFDGDPDFKLRSQQNVVKL